MRFVCLAMVIIVFVCSTIQTTVAVDAETYSLFAPKLYKVSSSAIAQQEVFKDLDLYGKLKDVKDGVISMKIDSNVVLVQLFKRLMSGKEAVATKSYRIMNVDGAFVVSFPVWPFGWKSYVLKIQFKDKNERIPSEDVSTTTQVITVDLLSPVKGYSSSGNRKLIRVNIEFSVIPNRRADKIKLGEMKVKFKGVSKGVSRSTYKAIVEAVSSYLGNKLDDEVKLLEVRKRQQEVSIKNSETVKQKKRAQKLDRILHPEKYKSKSPTVRSPGSGGTGSGRYVPSAATQARRVVRK